MKTYTFTFDNKKTNNKREIPTSTNYSAIIDATICSNIKKNNPWLFGIVDRDYKPIIIEKRPTTRTIDIDISIPAKRYSTSFTDLAKAIRILNAYEPEKDNYDFKLDDGTIVKLFSDEIQIGYDLIPLNNFTKAIYDKLSESTKKNIIDLTIIINKD